MEFVLFQIVLFNPNFPMRSNVSMDSWESVYFEGYSTINFKEIQYYYNF